MLPLRYAGAWLATGIAILVFGLYAALSSGGGFVPANVSDKLVHASAFLAFMLWFSGLFEARRAPWIALALTAYGMLIEVLQAFTPTRQPEVLDVVADVAGILAGWLLAAAGLRLWCVKLEAWFASPRA